MNVLKQSLEHQRKELNDCRAEITSLKMHMEGSQLGNNLVVSDTDNVQSESLEKYKEEIKKLQKENEWLKEKNIKAPESENFVGSENGNLQTDDKGVEIHDDRGEVSNSVDVDLGGNAQSPVVQPLNQYDDKHEDTLPELFHPADTNSVVENIKNVSEQNVGLQAVDSSLLVKSDSVNDEAISERTVSSLYS